MTLPTYDFVIVGGGTAGLVVASRLSEDSSQRILVIEAGSDTTSDPRVKTPAFYSALMGSEADWNFHSQPQGRLKGRSITLNQGKTLGGSSSINSQVFVPPNKDLVDSWETLGNDGWNWSTLRDYFSKAYTEPAVDEADEMKLGVEGWNLRGHASSGPLQLSFPGDVGHPIRQTWEETFKNIGYSMPDKTFLNSSIGSFSCLTTVDPVSKERCSSASAYYNPIKGRENLHVLVDAVAERIIFEHVDGALRASGVCYNHESTRKSVACSKEVIVAAGAFQSPKLLELSGIGNRELLDQHGIELVKDLPGVGENLQDHAVAGISFEARDDVRTLDALVRQEPDALSQAIQDYATNQCGWLTSMGLWSYAYLPTMQYFSEGNQGKLKELLEQHRPPAQQGPSHLRDREYYKLAEETLLNPKRPSGCTFAVVAQIISPVDPGSDSPTGPVEGNFISLVSLLSQPLSRGNVHISSSNPAGAPTIDPRYLSNPVDMDVFAHNMLYLETIARTPPLSHLLKSPPKRRDPASNLENLEDAKKFIESSCISMWHYGGTCAMLPEEKGGVVDPSLRVYGVPNVRVVDSSAVPLISNANMQSVVYAFAERAADLIKATYGLA
ncbi:aryl-alcohol dehydrogenase [Hypoxylon sp. FL1150]|nr:aryl-alcohol dehydrogenase [Hypoxylon sp. FL1150]